MRVKLEARQLWVQNQDRVLLKNINLSIEEKKITVLIGPSGCGKSTFLKCLNRMNEEEFQVVIKGRVLLDGEDIYHPKVNKQVLRKRVGMIFQQPVPFPMSIYENVVYGAKIHGKWRKKELEQIAERSLKQAGVWEEVKERLYEPADKLSGGQKQRLCMARALAVEPEVLLLDEPTSALDVEATEKIDELLLELKQNMTIVLVTHNLKQAEKIGDKIVRFPI